MIAVCGGWRGLDGLKVHTEPLVLGPWDGVDNGVSHGICEDCKAAFLERLHQLHEEERSQA